MVEGGIFFKKLPTKLFFLRFLFRFVPVVRGVGFLLFWARFAIGLAVDFQTAHEKDDHLQVPALQGEAHL